MNNIEQEMTRDLHRAFPKKVAYRGYEDIEGRVYNRAHNNTMSLKNVIKAQMSTKSDVDQYVKLVEMQYKIRSKRF
jgi:hypothetical protein